MTAVQSPAPAPLLTAARAWYEAGYTVIPSHEDGSKRPFGPWKQHQHHRPDWSQVEAWLSSGRYTGIGVLTGAASGNAELIEIEGPIEDAIHRLGLVTEKARMFDSIGVRDLLARIAAGCSEQSAGGGLHLFLRVTDCPAKGNTKLATAGGKVVSETRGEGGFVIVAPTPGRKGHPDGASYIFTKGAHPAGTVEVTGEERDILHTLFTMALHEDEPEPMPEETARVVRDLGGKSAFDDYRERVTWRDILAPAGWREGPVDVDGRTHWTRPGGLHFEGTSATTLEDGPLYVFSTNAGLPTDRGLSKGQVYAHLHHGGDLSEAARDLAGKGYGDVSPSAEIPAWEAALDADASEEDRKDAAAEWVLEHLPILDWHALWADETEEEWLVEPLLAKRRLVAIYSAPKVGKSLLMLEIAAALATGRPVLGNPATEPTRTLYVDFENDPRGDIRTRLESMGYDPDHLPNLCYLSFPNLAKLDTPQGAGQLLAALDVYDCQVVVVDTVSRAVAGDENENDTWLNFYKHTGLRLKQTERALIRLDHAGKDESKGQRGGSAKSGDVDAVWRMSKTGEEIFTLTCEAQRFSFPDREVILERKDDPTLHHHRTMDVRRQVEAEILPKYAAAGIPKDHELSVREVLKRMRAAGIKFTKAQVTTATLKAYRSRLTEFHPQTLETGSE